MSRGHLLDTHTWLWWNGAPERLSPRVRAILEDPENPIYFSVASAWEIAVKVALGKLELPDSSEAYIPARLADNGFIALAIQLPHVLIVGKLPLLHRDPFDRLLIAQARHEGLTLLSVDPLVSQYPVPVVWK